MALVSAVLAASAAAAAAADIGDSVGLKDYFGAERPPPKPPAAFRFSSAYSDDMVLQQAPAQAVVWGFAPAGSKVTIGFGGKSIDAPVAPYMGESAFMAKLPATPSSMTAMHNVTATSGGQTITLANVLFGDVWVCSGQSNMQYPIGSPTCWNASNINCSAPDAQCSFGCTQDAGKTIADMGRYDDGMRLFNVGGGSSITPQPEMRGGEWKTPSAMGGAFSAACWFFVRTFFSFRSSRPRLQSR